ncbi:LOW QUALITY PROTEIN: hypothetical protein ACHAWF_002717, partial [Thalassiosira exigua]
LSTAEILHTFPPECRALLADYGRFIAREQRRFASNAYVKFARTMGLVNPYMGSQPCQARNYFLACFAVALAQDQTIRNQLIVSRTVKHYLSDAGKLFRRRHLPYIPIGETDYTKIVSDAMVNYEKVPDRMNMITDSMTRWLQEGAKSHAPEEALDVIVDWVLLGRYAGFCKSEWCQSSQTTFKRIGSWRDKPPLAFILADFTFFDKYERRI